MRETHERKNMIIKSNNMAKVLSMDFSNEEVKDRDGVNFTVRTCPYCGRQWKVNVNLEKQCFRCPACDVSGNAAKLHAKMRGISVDEAYNELKMVHVETKYKWNQKKKRKNIASSYVRTLVYAKMLMSGELEEKHLKNLKDRGLTNTENYVSCSSLKNVKDVLEPCKHLFIDEENQKLRFSAIPGIYGDLYYSKYDHEEKYDSMKFNLPNNGFLVPIINEDEGYKRISCFQVRCDYGEFRYIYLSSIGKKNGIGVEKCNKVHYTNNFWSKDKPVIEKVPKVINLTEGALKADVAAELSNRPFIAIPGVNAYRDLKKELEFLKSKGCEQINIYFDMDYLTNENVQNALKKVTKIIEDAGLKHRRIIWDPKYKGIDDFLLHLKKNNEKN